MRFRSTSVAFLLFLTACSSGESPTTAAVTDPAAEATATPTATSAATAEPDPTDDTASGEVCQSGDMPDINNGWTFLETQEGTFAIAYPDDWEEMSGLVEFTVSSLVSEETFDELGLASDAKTSADFVRAPDGGVPNLSIYSLGEVDSSAEEIAERESARYEELDEFERMVDDSAEACLGGAPAFGVSFEFETGGDTAYQQSLFAVRNGELYVVQWLDEVDPDLELLDDIIATWGWIGGFDEPGGSGGIAEAHMASEVVESADGPDPATYTTTFESDAPGIYVVYRPESGSVGTVQLTWLLDGEVQLEGELDIDEDTTWAYGGITPAPGGFETGDYEVIVELGGDEETLEFTVEPAS